MKIKQAIFITFITLSSLVTFPNSPAVAQVIVNGELLTPEQIYFLSYTLQIPITDGNYWVNWETGAWGYAGSQQIQGNIYVNVGNPNQGYSSGGDNFRRIEGHPGRGDMYVGDGYFYDSDSGCSVMDGEVLC